MIRHYINRGIMYRWPLKQADDKKIGFVRADYPTFFVILSYIWTSVIGQNVRFIWEKVVFITC